VPRPVVVSLILLLVACGDSDRKSDATADVRADVSGDVSKDVPVDLSADFTADAQPSVDSPDATVDVSASFCPALGIDCNPYLCRNGSCLSSCNSNTDCVAPATCRSGTCLGPNPQSCTQPAQCASGFCSHGVCCERACTSPCETCARPDSIGKCQPLPASMLPDAGCGSDGGGQ
jgi:hypothetical protein